jgi:hypothetical protein
MVTKALSTRLPEEIANHVEDVAESPATDLNSTSAVLRQIVTDSFD